MLVLKYSEPQDGTLELQSFSGKLIMNFLQGIWGKKKKGNLMVSVNLCSKNQSKYQVEQEYQTRTSEPTGVHRAKFT